MRIAMIISRFAPVIGGAEKQSRLLSQALVRRGHEVHVFTERTSVQHPSFECDEGVQVYRYGTLGKPPWSSLWFSLKLTLRLFIQAPFDILHVHMISGPSLFTLAVGRLKGIPVIVKTAGAGVTGDIGTSQALLRGRLKLWLFKKWARFIVCPSPKTFDEIKILGIPGTRSQIIPNGVDTQHFHSVSQDQKRQLRTFLKLPKNSLIAVYAGRWAPGKGVETLLSVWESAIKAPNFQWRLCLVIPHPPTPEQHARLAPLENRIHVFVGSPDPLPYYQTADLAILLSENEGLSNFLLEAMASGLPLLTSPAAAVEPLSESEGYSWQVPSEDPQSVLSLLSTLQTSTEGLSSKGNRARTRVNEGYSIDIIAQMYERLYQQAYAAV